MASEYYLKCEIALKLNDLAVYSNYRPCENVDCCGKEEISLTALSYVLIGLGYHLPAFNQIVREKSTTVFLVKMRISYLKNIMLMFV